MDRDKLAKWLLVIILVAGVAYYGGTKTLSRVHAVQKSVKALNTERDADLGRVQVGAAAQRTLDSKAFKDTTSALQVLLPPHPDLQQMIMAVDQTAAAVHVTVLSGVSTSVQVPVGGSGTATSGVSSTGATPGSDGLYVWQLGLTVTGDQSSIINFLQQLNLLPRLVQVTSVKITNQDTRDLLNKTQADITLLFFATGPAT